MRISDWSSDVCSSDLFGENLGGVLQLDPIVLNILAGSKMAIAAVICAGDMAKLPHLVAAERAIRNGHAQHIGMQLQIKAVLQPQRSEEHTSELQSLIRISYAEFCLKKHKHPK